MEMNLDKVKLDINDRLNSLSIFCNSLNKYPPIKATFEMDSMACYELFGISNDTLESLEYLRSILINGLYDDSDIAFVKVDSEFRITCSQDAPNRLSADELLIIIKSVNQPYMFYQANQGAIESYIPSNRTKGRPSVTEWRRLKSEANKILTKYGWEPSDFEKENRLKMNAFLQRRLSKETN